MKKIAYIVSTLRKSGPTNQLYYILKYLDRDLFEPHVITLSPEPEDSMIQKIRTTGCLLYSLNYNRIKGMFYAKKKLKSLFMEIRPDLFHTQGIRSDSLCQGIVEKKKHIMSIRNFPSEDYPQKFGFLKGHLLAYNHFRVINKVHHAIACSKMLSYKFKEKKGREIQFIQNGVDTETYSPIGNSRDKHQLRKKYQFNTSDILIVTIGSLIPRKNIKTIIKAFMLTQNEALQLLIIGTGSDEPLLKTMVKGNTRIHFPGYSDKVIEYLHMSDYYISSSFSEGLPNSVLEAMACGLPVFLSDIPSHRELFENSAYTGFFAPHNHKILLNLLKELPFNDWADRSKKMREIVETNFSAKKMSLLYQDFYKQISSSL